MKKRSSKILSLLLGASMILGSLQPITAFAKEKEAEVIKTEENTLESGENKYRMWYTSPGTAATWENTGLVIGNGTTGGILFGQVGKDQIHFNEKTLWTGGPSQSRPNYDGGNRDKAVTPEQLESIRKQADDHSQSVFPLGTGGLENVMGDGDGMGHYQDFGDLFLDFSETGMTNDNVTNYVRDLDMRTAISSLNYDYEGVHYEREYFVSHPDKVMVVHLSASEKEKLSFTASVKGAAGLTTTASADDGRITLKGHVNDNQLKCEMQAQLVSKGGKVTTNENGTVTVSRADEVTIVLSTGTDYKNEYPSYRGEDPHAAVTEKVTKAAKKSYKELKETHVEDYQQLFDRVELDLGGECPDIPTDQLMKNYRQGDYQLSVEEMIYQFGRYLMIAGSREGDPLPTNLAGIWCIGDPAWGGDFHFNVNVQMNYWPAYTTNLTECGTVFNDFMESLVIPGRVTAEKSAGVKTDNHDKTPIGDGKGFLVHTQNNPFGCTAPFGSQEYGWNIGGSSWAMQNVYDYYLFTGDEKALRETIYPMLKEMATFWNEFLWWSDYQQRLVVGPSVSAEQGPTVNGTTYDQSMVWEVYKMAIEASEILGVDEEAREIWKEKQSKLNPIIIGEQGQVKEWFEETSLGKGKAGNLAETNIPNFGAGGNANQGAIHRHTSQLIGLFPGTLINKDTKEWMDAAIKSLEQRSLNGTGWSKAMKINMYARTGLADDTYAMVRAMCAGNTNGILDNLLDSHPPFQIDGNYGLTAGITEMLLQSQLGYTQFLPALPSAWENGSVAGIKSRGNFTIGEKWENGLASSFTVCYEGSEKSNTFTGNYNNITKAVVTADGKQIETVKDEENNQITFEAEKGKVYTIDMSGANVDQLKEKAEQFLSEMNPQLAAVREELKTAIESSAANLGSVLSKAQLMNRFYNEYVKHADDIYYMTTREGLSAKKIDSMYVALRGFEKELVENKKTREEYEQAFAEYRKLSGILREQMSNRVISFSKESGEVTENTELVLSKSAEAEDYVIRYTTDGSLPNSESTAYDRAITLEANKNTTVRAALYLAEQRVSDVFTKQYASKSSFGQVKVQYAGGGNISNWGDTYVEGKMIDGNADTRWASKDVNGKPIEVLLDFPEEKVVDRLKFDVFVSGHNKLDKYEILVLKDGKYISLCEGGELAVRDAGGNHGYNTVTFEPVTTKGLKVILKDGYEEPSIWEIQALSFEQIVDPAGDAAKINEMIKLADGVDRNDPYYVNADADLKAAFEESVADAKAIVKLQAEKTITQPELDSREEFLRERYLRMGFGETDKSELEALMKQAELEVKGEYTRDSIYRLKKEMEKSKAILEDEKVRQPEVEKALEALRAVMESMQPKYEESDKISPTELSPLPDKWLVATENHSQPYLATNDSNAGTFEYRFEGVGIKVLTMNGSDQGILLVKIVDEAGKTVYEDEYNAYAQNRLEGAELLNEKFEKNGNYTLTISKKPGDSNWVEIGPITVYREVAEVVDRSTLEAELKASEGLKENEYTEASWSAFKTALERAQLLMETEDQDTCTSELKDAAEALSSARNNLVKKQEPVDVSVLKDALKEAKDFLGKEGYTQDSHDALQQAVLEVEAFLQGTYTQEDVYEKTAMLKDTVANLKADKTELQDAYDDVKDMEQGKVTDPSWAAFLKLREKMKKVLEDPKATPEQVEKILKERKEFRFEYVSEKPGPDAGDDSHGSGDKNEPGNQSGNTTGNGTENHQGTSQSDTPQTGDSAGLLFPIMLMFAAFVCGSVILVKKRNKK